MLTEYIAKGFASLGVVGAGILAVGLPNDADGWTMIIEKFGVLAFVIICAIGGLAFLLPRLLDMAQKWLERQDARYDKAQADFLAALDRRDTRLEKLTDSIDSLTDRVEKMK